MALSITWAVPGFFSNSPEGGGKGSVGVGRVAWVLCMEAVRQQPSTPLEHASNYSTQPQLS